MEKFYSLYIQVLSLIFEYLHNRANIQANRIFGSVLMLPNMENTPPALSKFCQVIAHSRQTQKILHDRKNIIKNFEIKKIECKN